MTRHGEHAIRAAIVEPGRYRVWDNGVLLGDIEAHGERWRVWPAAVRRQVPRKDYPTPLEAARCVWGKPVAIAIRRAEGDVRGLRCLERAAEQERQG